MKRSKFGVQVRVILGVGVVLAASVVVQAAATPAAKTSAPQAAAQREAQAAAPSVAQRSAQPMMAPRASNMASVPGLEVFQPSAMPTEKTAVKDLQAFLDRRITTGWQVRKIENLGGEMTITRGARIYVMDAMIDLKVLAAVSPRESEVMSAPWVGRLSGRRNENRTVRVRLTWIRKASGWTLRSIE